MRKGYLYGGMVAVIGLLTAVAANYHFVYGSGVSGVTIETKPSLSLSETLINMDTLGGMPMIAARANYPMYVSRLERRAAQVEMQRSRGCQNIYVGMGVTEVIPKCGQPDELNVSGGDSDLRWDSGVRIKTSGDKVTSVSYR